MGDGWRHSIKLIKELVSEMSEKPACITGARACLPEDCGGTPGYEYFLKAIADPEHELLEWLGGDEDEVKSCWPVFESMGKNIFYLGGIGNGQAYKLINNMAVKHIGTVERLCLIECLNLGLKVGLDLQKMIDVMCVSAGARLIQNMGFKPGLDEKEILAALRIPAANIYLYRKTYFPVEDRSTC